MTKSAVYKRRSPVVLDARSAEQEVLERSVSTDRSSIRFASNCLTVAGQLFTTRSAIATADASDPAVSILDHSALGASAVALWILSAQTPKERVTRWLRWRQTAIVTERRAAQKYELASSPDPARSELRSGRNRRQLRELKWAATDIGVAWSEIKNGVSMAAVLAEAEGAIGWDVEGALFHYWCRTATQPTTAGHAEVKHPSLLLAELLRITDELLNKVAEAFDGA